MTDKQMKFWDEVRYIVTTLEQAFLKGRTFGWETTREFSELHGKYYDYAYRLIRAAADFWNQHLADDYRVMFDCDFHGYVWKFHSNSDELRDLSWIGAIRTEGHRKRSINTTKKSIEINPEVEKDIEFGKIEIVIPNSAKRYEDNNIKN